MEKGRRPSVPSSVHNSIGMGLWETRVFQLIWPAYQILSIERCVNKIRYSHSTLTISLFLTAETAIDGSLDSECRFLIENGQGWHKFSLSQERGILLRLQHPLYPWKRLLEQRGINYYYWACDKILTGNALEVCWLNSCTVLLYLFFGCLSPRFDGPFFVPPYNSFWFERKWDTLA